MGEEPVDGYSSFSAFLDSRLAPAMWTCLSVENRQQDLTMKLARATALLRTGIDVELAEPNRSLISSMDRRATIQLRLQHTVEGLSIAAVTYYVVEHVAEGARSLGIHLEPALVSAICVSPVVGIVVTLLGEVTGKETSQVESGF